MPGVLSGWNLRAVSCIAVALLSLDAAPAGAQVRVLDAFEDAAPWRVVTSNQVSGSLREVEGVEGKALCLDYDFNGVSGYAGIQRDLPLEFPANYRFAFQLRGESPANDLQFKLVDASGDNVWWVNRPKFAFPDEWTGIVYRQRHISKAWGPDPDKVLRRSAKIEFTIYNNAGGAGSVCFDELTFEPLPIDPPTPPTAVSAQATTSPETAALAIDGDLVTAWQARGKQRLVLDLGQVREFGGMRLHWSAADKRAARYVVSLEDAHGSWREVRRVDQGRGETDWLALPEAESQRIALDFEGRRYALAEAQVQPLEFSSHPNEFIKAVAADLPRGWLPRGFSGEQPYWTILGIDGGHEQGLIGEDGAVEVARGGFSIEPFLLEGGQLRSWADVHVVQGLRPGGMPMPNVTWRSKNAGGAQDDLLEVLAFAQGTPGDSQLVTRYRLTNPHDRPREVTLTLAVRPLQVNPPSQFLNTVGGVSRIERLALAGGQVVVDGRPRVFASAKPDAAFATPFDAGLEVMRLADGDVPATAEVEDPTGLASGMLLYHWRLAPGETREVALVAPLDGPARMPDGFDLAASVQRAEGHWRDLLGQVRLRLPPQGQAFADTVHTALAHMLVSRIGPRLQPGTRSYSRSWIRDGAMISEGLLRLGRPEVVRDYLEWYAPYQFDNGKVPCCVDDRGSDPVPENDSHGELIFNIAEYWRYTGDRAFLEKMWPHVAGAFDYMEQLRASERTDANRRLDPAFYGMMPASISHEGYSAKPMHSYWDNFWALRGYKDAVEIARALGRDDEAKRMARARDQFRADLAASLRAATTRHGIDYLPGAAELGDFDPTSTTIALAPGGEQDWLPRDLLENTFERYWHEFVQRRDGQREWKDYTPYEWRNVAAFVRLGWRERAWEATGYFFRDRAPVEWNQWAEVVSRTPRTPFFVGDLPHAWVASDFLRSALDMFAYSRERDDSLVLAAGVPVDWLDGEGIAIEGLYTPHGRLGYTLRHADGELRLDLAADAGLPPGGLVLPWPYAGTPGATTIDGSATQWQDGELRITRPGARVRIAMP
ncbi:discoidin domain-containing protein [Pseudoxanthomonas daejeonensis]|uniref:Coagulation factor 5/8 type domain-containing protein n=1 Tax=Pseudoxanthomonas daejeonensis TaxID=266062 RepID=A0ABQ6Z5G5_9GAMM|nr:discoidin domain-containing protein [Pseudoxanthomonas daejeonensis]KAF1693244.1 coagulation factor 5/8 type domain-containing protein [Pseudoxanthomonas daejeonensis]